MSRLEPFGVYVHIPFCTKRCDYCAFATWTDRFHLVDEYVGACERDLSGAVAGGMAPATSAFFGGGTPSLLRAEQLGRLVAAIPRQPGAEVTVECNPETVDVAKLHGYRAAGVTRLSFGVQSMSPKVLVALGRQHDVAAVQRAVEAAVASGFATSYNVDLIFGGVSETVADWAETVTKVLALDPPPAHISAYGLTVEPGTPLAADPARHPDPDDQADKYLVVDELLSGAGLAWYEISNWARPGAECRHNQLYWTQGAYRGIGCSAHSHAGAGAAAGPGSPAGGSGGPAEGAGGPAEGAGGSAEAGRSRRWWNVRTPERYIRLISAGDSPEAAGEDLDQATQRLEGLQLALRTRDGVPEASLPGWPDDENLASLVAPGPAGQLVLTRRGRLLANEVALRLVP